jgi:hypothetical protein
MQYLRARYYNPATGTFNRLDPFAGNMQDPQSLHKYLYVHGDPVGMVDPSGCRGSLVGSLAVAGIITSLYTITSAAVFNAADRSVGYGAVTGFVGGSALSAALILRKPLPRVLSEASLSAVFSLAALTTLDYLAGEDLRSKGWEYTSFALEAFSWSAAGAMWLNPIDAMGNGGVGADDPVLLAEMAMALSIGGSAAQLMAAGLGLVTDAATMALLARFQGGLTPDLEEHYRSEVKDNVSTVSEVLIGAIPAMVASGFLWDKPGLRYMPPSLKGKVISDMIDVAAMPLVAGGINAITEQIGEAVANALMEAVA